MSAFLIEPAADVQLDEIYAYTVQKWGLEQADRYLNGIFDKFEAIAGRTIPWRPIPAALDAKGYVCKYERHYIYWRVDEGQIAIALILHERMDQWSIVRDDF